MLLKLENWVCWFLTISILSFLISCVLSHLEGKQNTRRGLSWGPDNGGGPIKCLMCGLFGNGHG